MNDKMKKTTTQAISWPMAADKNEGLLQLQG